MRSFRKTFLFGTVLAACAYAPLARPDTLAVVCKSDFNLTLLDPATEKVLAKLPADRGPHEVALVIEIV